MRETASRPARASISSSWAGRYAFGNKEIGGFEQLTLADFNEPMQVVMADGNLAGRGVMAISCFNALAVDFDGSAERAGAFDISASQGDDTFTGGAGADTINGGLGADRITGGLGADVLYAGDAGEVDIFVYGAAADSTKKAADLVTLTAEDIIDLSAIDARTDKAGDQAFRLVSAFDGHAGELMVSAFDNTHNWTSLLGDVDGDGRADLVIHLAGDQTAFTGFVL